MPPGDFFAFTYYRIVSEKFTVSWTEFQDWPLWMLAATVGLDRIDATDEDQALYDEYMEASNRAPSSDRKG